MTDTTLVAVTSAQATLARDNGWDVYSVTETRQFADPGYTKPKPKPAPVPTPALAGPLFGMNGHDLMWATAPVAQLTALGAKVHRCDLAAEVAYNVGAGYTYGNCLGTPGCATAVGTWASDLRAAGIQPFVVITFTSIPDPTVFAADLAALVKAVPGLWIEVGNELDGTSMATQVTEYLAMFSAAVKAAVVADPTCKIGPAPVSNINPGGGGWNWLSKLFAGGLASIAYDFLPFHNYPWPSALGPTVVWASGYSVETMIDPFIAQCTAWGNKAPCWMTEGGYQSVDASATPNMTPALQASYLTAFLASPQVKALAVALVYELVDGGGETYGLIDGSGTEKPAFAAVASAFKGS